MDTLVDKVEVGIHDKIAYVRVCGRATFKVGPSLKEFGTMAIEQGCSCILVEMKDCVGMDSTFMGVLAGLSTLLKKSNGEVVLSHLTDKNLFLLKMLGLLHLVRIDTAQADASLSELAHEPLKTSTDKVVMTRNMINAHEALVDVSPDNIVKFKDVLAYLKEDLRRSSAP